MPRTNLPDLTITEAIAEFARDLRLEKSPKTIETYVSASEQFAKWDGAPTNLNEVSTQLVRAWLTSLRDSGRSPATVFNRANGLKALLRWATEERLIGENPMSGLRVPAPEPTPIPILSTEELKALLKATGQTDFESLRDHAMLRLLIDTGIRREECAGLKIEDLDFDLDTAVVLGKGSRIRGVAFGARTSKAMRRYLRLRQGHEYAHLPQLWLGRRGPLAANSILLMLRRRARQAGINHRVFVHQLRHTWAHEAMQRMNESDVQRLGGWKDRDMLSRYGASGADERARRAYRDHSLGDRL